MHVRRDLLFSGLFLIPVGAITLLVRAGTLDPDRLLDAPRLWPLLLVGIGIAILLGRSRAASLGTAVVALVIGVLVGSAIASGPVWIGTVTECGPNAAASTHHIAIDGAFSGPAALDLRLRCGSVAVSTQPGDGWTLTGDYQGPAPTVNAAGDHLAVGVPEGGGVRHHDWTIKVPAGRLGSVTLRSDAATGSLTLDGAVLSEVVIEANAGDVVVDAGNATLGRIDAHLNAGRVRLTLGTSATVGDLDVNAGAMDVCVPAGANLRLVVAEQLTFLTNLADRGLQRSGEIWTRSGSGPLIDLHIEGNAASLTLDPNGGCR
jgi:hypothetical protein